MTTPQTPGAGLPRRTVLASGAGVAAVGATGTTLGGTLVASDAAPARDRRVFAHGVASGDPMPTRVVIWTRVTPTAASRPGSGKGPQVRVRWEVARDSRFQRVVRSGTFTTSANRDHTVKVDVRGLKPATGYHYRFSLDGARSRVGRTRTAPARNALPRNLRLGVVSCSNWQAGFFAAYRGLAARDDLHAVVHLGDYLYEYGVREYGEGEENRDVREHDPRHEIVSLEDYRRRHAQYKTDPDLQALHARHPFIVTWDDHEVTNDQWREGAENHQPNEGDYRARRARAHRAYDEWMPVRMSGTASLRDGTRLFRRLRFGRLAEISMLDLRTYRDQQVATIAPSPVPSPTPGVSDPGRTILGAAQMAWLKRSLHRGGAQWKLVGNPVMIAPVTFGSLPLDLVDPVNDVTGLLPSDGAPYNVDQWDGYTADRREIFGHIRDHGVDDTVFITGDIHSGWACELPYDVGAYPLAGATAGVEFVCTSVTSNNLKDILGVPPRTASRAVEELIKVNNRHIKYLDFDSHGFSVLDITPERAQMDWYVIGERSDRGTSIRHSVSYRTRTGTRRVERVAKPVR